MYRQQKQSTVDPVPTSYFYSALYYASIGSVASTASFLTAIAGVFAVWRIYVSRSIKPITFDGMKWVWVAVIGYYSAGVLSASLHPSDPKSIAQLVERIPFLFFPFLIVFFACVSNPVKLLRHCVYGAMVGIVALTLYFLSNRAYLNGRFEALSGNPNVFGYMCVVLFIWLSAGLRLLKAHSTRVTCIIVLFISVAFTAYSGSRGPNFALLVSGILFLYFILYKFNAILFFSVTVMVLFSFLIVSNFTIFGIRFSHSFGNFFASGLDVTQLDPLRAVIWKCGLRAGLTSPIFGLGYRNALEYLALCSQELGTPVKVSHFHNLFIDQFAKAGIVGLLSASLLMLMPLVLLIRWLRDRYVRSAEPILRMVLGIGLSLWSLQMISAFFNIGFGHDAIDANFVYSNALILGSILAVKTNNPSNILHSTSKGKIRLTKESSSELEIASSASILTNNFVLGFSLALILGGVVFLFLGHIYGYNRLTIASGGYAVSSHDAKSARQATLELRNFVDRLEAELLSPNSAIQLPNADQFHNVATIWREEFLKLSETTRRLQGVYVRKQGSDYKILLSGPICPIAISSGLFRIDPQRQGPYATLCMYFSVWGGKGSSF